MASNVGRIEVQIGANNRDFMRGMQQVEQRMQRVGRRMQLIGGAMSVAVTAPIVALGAAAIRTAGQFETSMNRVQAFTGATAQEFERLEELAKQLGATTEFSASQAADAMSFLASAGMNTTEIMSALPGVLQLATAGQLDLARAADITTNVLTGFGMTAQEVGRVNDVLAQTAAGANTTVEQLGSAMSFVAPVAAGFGLRVEDAAAGIAALSDAGIQGERAGTALTGIIVRLNDRAEELGITTLDAAGRMLPLANIIEQLEANGTSTATIMEELGQRAGPGLVALISQGSDALRDQTTVLENSAGAAEEMASTMRRGVTNAFRQVQSAWEALMIAVADSGLLEWVEAFAVRLADALRWLASLNPEVLRFGVAVAGVAAALGPALVALGTLGTLLPIVATGLRSVAVAMLPLFGPAGLVIAAGAMAITLAQALQGKPTSLKESAEGVDAALSKMAGSDGTIEGFKKALDDTADGLTGKNRDAWDTYVEGIRNAEIALQDLAATEAAAARERARLGMLEALQSPNARPLSQVIRVDGGTAQSRIRDLVEAGKIQEVIAALIHAERSFKAVGDHAAAARIHELTEMAWQWSVAAQNVEETRERVTQATPGTPEVPRGVPGTETPAGTPTDPVTVTFDERRAGILAEGITRAANRAATSHSDAISGRGISDPTNLMIRPLATALTDAAPQALRAWQDALLTEAEARERHFTQRLVRQYSTTGQVVGQHIGNGMASGIGEGLENAVRGDAARIAANAAALDVSNALLGLNALGASSTEAARRREEAAKNAARFDREMERAARIAEYRITPNAEELARQFEGMAARQVGVRFAAIGVSALELSTTLQELNGMAQDAANQPTVLTDAQTAFGVTQGQLATDLTRWRNRDGDGGLTEAARILERQARERAETERQFLSLISTTGEAFAGLVTGSAQQFEQSVTRALGQVGGIIGNQVGGFWGGLISAVTGIFGSIANAWNGDRNGMDWLFGREETDSPVNRPERRGGMFGTERPAFNPTVGLSVGRSAAQPATSSLIVDSAGMMLEAGNTQMAAAERMMEAAGLMKRNYSQATAL